MLLSNASKNAGYTYTSRCLDNAIAGYPNGSNGDLVYAEGTDFSNTIKSSSEFQGIHNQAKTYINSGYANFSSSGSVAFTSNTDLYLSLHRK